MLEKLKKKLFYPKATGIIHEMGGGWGDRIEWFDFKTGKIVGWKGGEFSPTERKPGIGDEVQGLMQSGKIARFLVLETEYLTNPSDMFFAAVTFIGYKD